MKLYATIKDREAHLEHVVLCQFKDSNDEDCFVESIERYGMEMFKIVADEGYVHTEYFYPVERYTIIELSIYEE